MTRKLLAAAVLLALASALPASAHEVRPGYLEIGEKSAESFDVLWKVPAIGQMRLAIHPRFPKSCQVVGEPVRFFAVDAYSERSSLSCPGGLDGRTIAIEGLAATMTDVLVRYVRANGDSQVVRLKPAAAEFVVEPRPSRLQVSATYLKLGVEHILFGIDHLLFVLALLLLVKSGRHLVATVTAFTVAHSLTLAAATLGWVHVPQRPVEAVIALSIMFVACEIVHVHQGRAGLAEQWPWIVAFVFGLLHGFGFASALSQVGLPQQAIPLALFVFNVGVELGQLLFIGVALAVMAGLRRLSVPWLRWAWGIPAYGIGGMAAYWTVERVAGFWR